ncbi:hypothetical protein ABBQ38_007112 [Trebouxia sp. C0009 RCD-2024]
MANIPPGESLASPTGTSGRSEVSEDDEDVAMETDSSGRFSRYNHTVGKGRFKRVYKGFDEKQGIDIAWSKIQREANQLDEDQIHQIAAEMSIGVDLDHPNVIRCFKCWADKEQNCVNLITEYFTSGNLREYRSQHKHLELKAVKKWGKQILQGLSYLHDKIPPIVHGDLRCDKIYINGHSGEIKIGDLGLATLLPRRFSPGVLPDGVNKENQYTQHVDIFAFGLCLLELATLKRLDSNNCQIWPELLASVTHEDARKLMLRCLDPQGVYPSPAQLLQDPFFIRKLQPSDSQKKLVDGGVPDLGRTSSSIPVTRPSIDTDGPPESITCAAGTVRGEDYNFHFTGKIKDNKLYVRLHLEYEGDDEQQLSTGGKKTIDFTYDPDGDTPEAIAKEIGDEFDLSSTDRDICAAALKEWLAKETPDSSR